METVALILTCFTFLFCELIPTMLYVFLVLTDFRLRVKVMASGLFTLIEILKYSCTILYKNQVRNCLKFVDEDWQNVINPSDRISMIDRVRMSKRLIMMCATFVYLTGMAVRIIVPLSIGKIVISENITIRPLPHVAYLVILDVQRSPVYEIVYFIQFLAGFIKYTISITTFSFMTLCAMHFCGQSDILVMLMNDFVNENKSKNVNRKLAIVVERQIRIRKVKVMASGLYTLIEIIKYSCTLLYKNEVRNCLKFVEEDWRNVINPSDRISMIDRVRTSKRLIMMCAIFMYFSGMGFRIIIPLSTGKIITSENITIRPLPHVAYLVILDVQSSPVYEIVYFIQFLSGLIKYTITVTTFGFMTLCAMHFCAQSDILVTLMNDFVNENQPKDLNKRLAIVVERQIRIRNFLQLVQSTIQYTSLIQIMGSTVMICLVGYYVIMVRKNFRLRLKVMASGIFTIIEIIKYSYAVLYKSQVKNCLILVDEDWRNVINPNDRISMIDRVRTSKRLIVICAIIVYVTGMAVRMIIPLSVGKIVTSQNITIRPLPHVAYLVIFDVQHSPVYEIVYFVQFLAGLIKYTITVTTFGFMTLCAMHFCAQSDILMTLMNNFVNENQPENLNTRLATVVEHQIRIRNFLQLVQSTTQYPSLIEILGSTVLLCFAGYYIIMEWEDHNVIRLCAYISVLIMFCFNIFIYCYMGEQIIEQNVWQCS
ncbi:PREDICTED: uncharacterized protein LOC108752406 [Trachymyrmex septentrionalis]|uniref:uncharacterized protein LOC108752406 n=1 Tax=Trachymyrmex septentrionalis TaxID=34720 RepID=UPI00084F7AC2|nr:PREDICTED: uncharacterized protein LOC108752406 [Trachymyrmex septentrionalis]